MTVECPTESKPKTLALLRLSVVAEADPGAILHVVERFRNLNVLPRCVTAEFTTTGVLRIQVDAAGLEPERMTLIAAKLAQVPCVLGAHWYPV